MATSKCDVEISIRRSVKIPHIMCYIMLVIIISDNFPRPDALELIILDAETRLMLNLS